MYCMRRIRDKRRLTDQVGGDVVKAEHDIRESALPPGDDQPLYDAADGRDPHLHALARRGHMSGQLPALQQAHHAHAAGHDDNEPVIGSRASGLTFLLTSTKKSSGPARSVGLPPRLHAVPALGSGTRHSGKGAGRFGTAIQ